MNERFKQLSLMAGGSHYPTVNPDLQQRFGELIVLRMIEMLDKEIELAYEVEDVATAATLQALSLSILAEFDMEVPEDDWDAEGELQKIMDEFDMGAKDE